MHATTLSWWPYRQGRRASTSVWSRAREYLASDSRRAFQTALGLIWLLDAGLQFQPFMYSQGFAQLIQGNASGQPHWLASSINWAANLTGPHLSVFNTLFALTQLVIGLGLLYRRTVKSALAVSIAWALIVWWVGEGFGHLFAGMAATSNPQTFATTANPLGGAPGAAVLYAVIALLLWPNDRPGGLLGVRGARVTWAVLWLAMAGLWLAPVNRSAGATQNVIMMAPTGMSYPAGMAWLNRLQDSASDAAAGHGLAIALALAVLSVAIAVAVATNWRPTPFLGLAILLSLGYWVVGQGFGGMFYTNSATDPNAGPLFVLLALVLYSLTPIGGRLAAFGTARPRLGARARPAALLTPLLAITAAGVAATAIVQTPNVAPQPLAAASPFDGQAIAPSARPANLATQLPGPPDQPGSVPGAGARGAADVPVHPLPDGLRCGRLRAAPDARGHATIRAQPATDRCGHARPPERQLGEHCGAPETLRHDRPDAIPDWLGEPADADLDAVGHHWHQRPGSSRYQLDHVWNHPER